MTGRGDVLLISEVFGPTVQGEGRLLGQRCSFVRLGACNLSCSWCDTPYTWDRTRYDLASELRTRPVEDVLAEVASHRTSLTVVTGGEPLLQQSRPGWARLVSGLTAPGGRMTVETNGTIVPMGSPPRVSWTVSPKLANSGEPENLRLVPEALQAFTALARAGMADFKFVVRAEDELDEVSALVQAYVIPTNRVWIMPEGTSPAAVAAHGAILADAAIGRGYNLTTRLHVALWGAERGR